jgi:2'-hydroxyisoflavone reductase
VAKEHAALSLRPRTVANVQAVPTVKTALVLGGTESLGIHLVERLAAAGWKVDLFNRGITNPSLFPDLRLLTGDRASDVDALKGGRWDVVYDLSGYQPDAITRSAEHLRLGCAHYIFLSSISVYASFVEGGTDESGRLSTLKGGEPAEVTPESYGPLKARCEQRVLDAYPLATIVRPAVIAGPLDPTDRFTYWVARLGSGGRHIVPPDPSVHLQYVDARDLADRLVHVAERSVTGTFNAAGPRLTFSRLAEAIATVTGVSSTLVSPTYEQLRDAGVRAWMDIPLWLPPDDVSMANFFDVGSRKARAFGQRERPPAETIDDVWSWCRGRSTDLRCGLTPEREAQVLDLIRP